MANGPFGNPLTTGIALTFDVDMTPYDNMLKRNAAKAAEKAKADKDLLDKYNEYAKNITVDFDKIDYRLHDKARAKYAETLAELNKAVMNKDLHAANMLMMDSKQFNSNLVQRTSDLNEIFNQDPTKVYYNPEIEKIWKDRSIPNDDKRIVEIISKYGSQDELIGSFKKSPSRRNLKTDVDNLLEGAERRLQPGDKPIMYLPTGEAVYEQKYTNKDEIRNQVIMDYTSPQNIESTIYMLTEDYGISPSELQGKDIPETQEKLTAAIDRVFDPIWSSIESEQYKSRPPRDTDKTGYTRPGVMGKVQIAEAQTTPISREAFNIDEYRSGAQPVIESKVLDILKRQGSNDPEKGVITELENLLQGLVIVEDVNDYFSAANLISVAAAVGEDTYGTPVEIDLNDQDAAAKKIAEVLSGASDENLKEIGNNVGFEYAAPSSVIKDFEKTAQVSTFGGDVRKSYEMPKGEIYMVGSKGAQVVKIRNAINVAGSLFKSFNRDKDGKVWHGIDFPVEEQSAITSLLEQALGRESIDDFIKSNGIPKTFYVPETQKNVATFLTTDSQGKLTPEFLDAELKKIGVYGSGTQSSESSGEVEVDEFGFPIEN
jgi:hypothetical protein